MQRGFTLLEILVVLVIGAVMYAMILGVPFRGASVADLKSAARTLASGLRQAQSMAMVSRRARRTSQRPRPGIAFCDRGSKLLWHACPAARRGRYIEEFT